MARKYAQVIIDISHEKVDHPFSYRIPERLLGNIRAGVRIYGFPLEPATKREPDM